MKTTLDKHYYGLIERFPLVHIRDDKQLYAAQAIVDELVDKFADGAIAAGEKEYLDALSDLVVAYESKRFDAGPGMSPVEMLRYLMDQNGLTQADLAPLFGGQSRVSDFLSGKRDLSKAQIEKLSDRFKLSPTAFFAVPSSGTIAASASRKQTASTRGARGSKRTAQIRLRGAAAAAYASRSNRAENKAAATKARDKTVKR